MKLIKAVKNTTDYFNKYNCHLTKKEFAFRLISNRRFSEELINKQLGRENNLKMRINHPEFKKKMELARIYTKKMKKNLNVLFIGITGSVATKYPKKNDDIDLLIITRVNTLWVSRLQIKLSLLKDKIPHRKYENRDGKNQLCLNLWLDEAGLFLPKNKQNLKNAMDLILIKQLLNREKIYQRLIKRNDWAKKYVAIGYSKLNNRPACRTGRSLMIDGRKKTINIFDWIINYFLFKFQYWYMRPKLKKEIVNIHQAFFHPNG